MAATDVEAPIEHPFSKHLFGEPVRGVLPGLAGGLLMAFVLCFLALARGAPFYQPLAVISALALGGAAAGSGAVPALIGLLLHFALSAALGMAFAFLAGPTTRVRLLGLGFAYGFWIWAMAQFVVLPLMSPTLAAQLGNVWTFFLGHLAYGLMLAACVPTPKDIDDPYH